VAKWYLAVWVGYLRSLTTTCKHACPEWHDSCCNSIFQMAAEGQWQLRAEAVFRLARANTFRVPGKLRTPVTSRGMMTSRGMVFTEWWLMQLAAWRAEGICGHGLTTSGHGYSFWHDGMLCRTLVDTWRKCVALHMEMGMMTSRGMVFTEWWLMQLAAWRAEAICGHGLATSGHGYSFWHDGMLCRTLVATCRKCVALHLEMDLMTLPSLRTPSSGY